MLTSEEIAQAACKGMDTNLFYSGMTGRYANELAAKAVCVACPVRMQCLQQALDNEELGIWGGTTELERRAMIRQQRRGSTRAVPLFKSEMTKEELVAERRKQALAESNSRRAAAASEQLRGLLAEAKKHYGAALPPLVIQLVEWKIANPTMSYAQIGPLMNPPITKDKATGLIRKWIKERR